jgi:amphi-Trp domain-containing protein
MDDEATLYDHEQQLDRAAVASYLRRIADGIERGRVELGEGAERIVVEPPDDLMLEIEVELEDEGDDGLESSIEIEISWREGAPRAAERD